MPNDALECERLRAREKALEAQVLTFKTDQFVPDQWHCPKCGFVWSRPKATPDAAPGLCPNDDYCLVRQSWKARSKEAMAATVEQGTRAEEWELRALGAEARLREIAERQREREAGDPPGGYSPPMPFDPDAPRECPGCLASDTLVAVKGLSTDTTPQWSCTRCGSSLQQPTVDDIERGTRAIANAIGAERIPVVRLLAITRFLTQLLLGPMNPMETYPVPLEDTDLCTFCKKPLPGPACSLPHKVQRKAKFMEWNGLNPRLERSCGEPPGDSV